MRPRFVLALSILLCISPLVKAEPPDIPGDLFIDAYVIAQQAEKEEHAGHLNVALLKLRTTTRLLDQIGTEFPQWSPPILTYRKQRTAAALERVREKIARESPFSLFLRSPREALLSHPVPMTRSPAIGEPSSCTWESTGSSVTTQTH